MGPLETRGIHDTNILVPAAFFHPETVLCIVSGVYRNSSSDLHDLYTHIFVGIENRRRLSLWIYW